LAPGTSDGRKPLQAHAIRFAPLNIHIWLHSRRAHVRPPRRGLASTCEPTCRTADCWLGLRVRGALSGNAAPLRPGTGVHQVSQGHTLCTVLAHTAESSGDQLAYSDRLGPGGQLRALTWRQFRETTRKVAAGLITQGVSAGDRVAVMATNRIEHIITDAAALHAGGIPVPIYLTAAPEQIAAIAAQCTPTVLVADPADQLTQWEPALARMDRLKLIVGLDTSEEAGSQLADVGRCGRQLSQGTAASVRITMAGSVSR